MKARKRFGQHYLTDEGVLLEMARCIAPGADQKLLEIGPGHGALTRYLFGETAEYQVVEIDRDLIAMLLASFPGMVVHNADILKLSLSELLRDGGWRLVGNLPYNISTPLLVKLYGALDQIQDMHFMFQRELALRLGASPGTKDWGRLSVVTQYHCTVEPLFDVGPEAFSPPPKVFSQVVRMCPRMEKTPVDPVKLDLVLRTAFSARRKRITNALKGFGLDWDRVGVDVKSRPDQLSLEQFVAIANSAENLG